MYSFNAVYSRAPEKMPEQQVEAILAHVCRDETMRRLVADAGGLKATKMR